MLRREIVLIVFFFSVSECVRYYMVDFVISLKYIFFYVVGKKIVENVFFNGIVVLYLG